MYSGPGEILPHYTNYGRSSSADYVITGSDYSEYINTMIKAHFNISKLISESMK